MRKKQTILFLVFLFALIRSTLLLTSCASGGTDLRWEGRMASEEIRIDRRPSWELTVTEDNRASLVLPYEDLSVITGEAYPEGGGSWIFYTDSLEWFGNWEKGWTEARFSLTGSLELIPRADSWELQVRERPVIDTVMEGTIRFGDKKYFGDRARDQISRRWTRIEAAARYALPELDRKSYSFSGKRGLYRSEEYMEDLEFILWDSGSSDGSMPEELKAVRDAGTLYRDYREGRGLFFLALTWPRIWGEDMPQSRIEFNGEAAMMLPKE